MSGELLWAVTDGPAGAHVVALPEDAADARRLERHYRGAFWCSWEAGGCGERLVLRGEDAARPSFDHPFGSACVFTVRAADADRAYEHLRYQQPLVAWLAGQGHSPRLGKVTGPDGGADLHVVVDDVGAALEVQLSPLPDAAWRDRDDRSHRQLPHVSWLYGPAAEAAAATEAAVRGVSFAIRRQGRGLVVGVRDAEHRTRWVRLAACRLTVDGFWAPGVDEAGALHARRTAEREEAARRVAQQAGQPAATDARGRRGARRVQARRPWNPPLTPLPFPG